MKIICFKEGKENRVVLLDGNRTILTNWLFCDPCQEIQGDMP